MNGKGDVELELDRSVEQLAVSMKIRDETVALSDKTWNVVIGLELLEINVASMSGPPKRVVLNESPYSALLRYGWECAALLDHTTGQNQNGKGRPKTPRPPIPGYPLPYVFVPKI